MVDVLPLIGIKVVLRLLSPRGKFVINGGCMALVPSTTSEPTGTPGVLVMMAEPLIAEVAFMPSPSVETGMIPVGIPSSAAVVFELEMPGSLVATEDTAEVKIADAIPDSIIVDGVPVLGEGMLATVEFIPIAPLMSVDST